MDKQVSSIFPNSERAKKWNEFRDLTNLNIPDLEASNTKSCIYISITGIGIMLGLYLIFSNQDLSFFTMLHPEILGIGFIAIITLIVGIDYFAKKMKPNDKIPYSVNSEDLKGFIGRILTYNQIKEEFDELYFERFEKLKST